MKVTRYLEEFFVVGSLSRTVFGIGRVHMDVYCQSREKGNGDGVASTTDKLSGPHTPDTEMWYLCGGRAL